MLNRLVFSYDNNSITLENITTVAILGDNGVGKTALLERIALVNEDNISTILNVKGVINYESFSVSIDNQEVKCERVEANRTHIFNRIEPNGIPVPIISEMRHYDCKGSIKYKVMIIYPYTFRTSIHKPHYDAFVKPNDKDMEFNRIIKGLMEGLIDGNVISMSGDFVYEDNNSIKYLDSLGRGISNTVKLVWIVYYHKPDILLIDDIETLGLHPKRLQTLLKWFVQHIKDNKLKAMLFTTNSDAYVDLIEVDENAKALLLQRNNYIVIDREEVLDRLDYEDLRYTALKGKT
jgi:AAA15 family ATPase/GTPase